MLDEEASKDVSLSLEALDVSQTELESSPSEFFKDSWREVVIEDESVLRNDACSKWEMYMQHLEGGGFTFIIFFERCRYKTQGSKVKKN